MRRRKRRAAWLLRWREFHELNSSSVRIIDVELRFSVLAHLHVAFGGRSPATRFELLCSFFYVRDTEGKMIEHSKPFWRHLSIFKLFAKVLVSLLPTHLATRPSGASTLVTFSAVTLVHTMR